MKPFGFLALVLVATHSGAAPLKPTYLDLIQQPIFATDGYGIETFAPALTLGTSSLTFREDVNGVDETLTLYGVGGALNFDLWISCALLADPLGIGLRDLNLKFNMVDLNGAQPPTSIADYSDKIYYQASSSPAPIAPNPSLAAR